MNTKLKRRRQVPAIDLPQRRKYSPLSTRWSAHRSPLASQMKNGFLPWRTSGGGQEPPLRKFFYVPAAVKNAIMPPSRGQFISTVAQNIPLCREHFKLILEVEAFPPTRAGQFIQISCRSVEDTASE